MPAFAIPGVTATPAALELIERLQRKHGPVALFQSGGCCDGSAPMCLSQADLPPGSNDLKLGEIGDSPFYVDRDQYRRWNSPHFMIDVAPGEAGGFSLEGLEDVHFVSRSPHEAGVTN